MNPRDNKPETDPGAGWEEDLEAVRSTLSDMESVEPPDLLDQAVLNTARRELAASRRKPMRWIGAFATATVVVLAMTIVIQQEQKTPAPGPQNGIKQNADKPVSIGEVSTIGSSTNSKPRATSPQAASVLSSEEAVIPAKQLEFKRQKSSTINAPAAPLLEADNDAGNSADSTPVQEQLSVESGYRTATDPARRESRAEFEDELSDLQSEPALDAVMQAGAVENERTGDTPADSFRKDSIAPKKLEEISKEDLSEESFVEEGQGKKAMLAPQAWIEHLLDLYEAGKIEELKTELAAFRDAYPEYPLPPELLD